MNAAALNGLDMLATAVLVIDDNRAVLHMNSAAENLFEASHTSAAGLTTERLLGENTVLEAAISYSRTNSCSYTEHEIETTGNGRQRLNLSCTVSPAEIDAGVSVMLLEFRQIDQQLRVEREARLLEQSQAHRELIRNLAHEIKNPLGGIRGAAQLLDRELERPALHEYTQVIIQESDRLQALMDRLLTPHRLPLPGPVNIHGQKPLRSAAGRSEESAECLLIARPGAGLPRQGSRVPDPGRCVLERHDRCLHRIEDGRSHCVPHDHPSARVSAVLQPLITGMRQKGGQRPALLFSAAPASPIAIATLSLLT